jgi:hypothetical protein
MLASVTVAVARAMPMVRITRRIGPFWWAKGCSTWGGRMAWQRRIVEAERRIEARERQVEALQLRLKGRAMTDLATAITAALDTQARLADAERLGMIEAVGDLLSARWRAVEAGNDHVGGVPLVALVSALKRAISQHEDRLGAMQARRRGRLQ